MICEGARAAATLQRIRKSPLHFVVYMSLSPVD
jgi:hypothetical protein